MYRYRLCTLLILLASLSSFQTTLGLSAAETGHLKMRFIYEGQPPPQKMLKTGRPEGEIPDESLIVNEANHGIKNVCVWLFRTPGDQFAVDEVKPREQESRVMTLKGGNFSPRIEILRVPQAVQIRNADPWGYNIVSGGGVHNRPFSALLKPGESMHKLVEFREPHPMKLQSAIQPWVVGYLLALDQPHAAISDADGRLIIRDIPIGNWAFVVWHERSGVLKKALHDGQPIDWPEGLMSYAIKPEENDLGEYALLPEQLRLK